MVRRPFLFEDEVSLAHRYIPIFMMIRYILKSPPIFLGKYTALMLHLALMNISLSYST